MCWNGARLRKRGSSEEGCRHPDRAASRTQSPESNFFVCVGSSVAPNFAAIADPSTPTQLHGLSCDLQKGECVATRRWLQRAKLFGLLSIQPGIDRISRRVTLRHLLERLAQFFPLVRNHESWPLSKVSDGRVSLAENGASWRAYDLPAGRSGAAGVVLGVADHLASPLPHATLDPTSARSRTSSRPAAGVGADAG